MKRLSAIGALLVAVSLLGAACTVGGPAPTDWKVKPATIKVVTGEDMDAGDEPYVIQVGFRSKLGVAGSTHVQVASQCRSGALPATDAAEATVKSELLAMRAAAWKAVGELAAVGGDYATLPCTMTYEVDGAQRAR